MTELQQEIYNCILHRLSAYCTMIEYTKSSELAEKNLNRLKQTLSQEQARILENFIGEYDLTKTFEMEAVFQATFSLAIELHRL